MSNFSKIGLGLLTLLPVPIIIGITGYILATFVFEGTQELSSLPESNPAFLFGNLFVFFGLIAFLAIIGLGLSVFYIIQALNNENLDRTMRIIWVLIFLFTSTLGQIMYWYLYIWKNQQEETSPYQSFDSI